MDDFFKPSTLHGNWIDGITLSDGDPRYGNTFLHVLKYIKKQNFKIKIDTHGINADLLERVVENDLIDRIVMEIKGTLELYPSILQQAVDTYEIIKSIELVSDCKEYKYITIIAPIFRTGDHPDSISYLTPEEIEGVLQRCQSALKHRPRGSGRDPP